MAAVIALRNILGDDAMDIISSYLNPRSLSVSCGTGGSVGNISEFDIINPLPTRFDHLYSESLELEDTFVTFPAVFHNE